MKNIKSIAPLAPLALLALGLAGCQTTKAPARPTGEIQPSAHSMASDPAPEATSLFSASVTPALGRFYFPIQNITRQWQWQAAPANALEYQWAVTVSLKEATYQFGFSRFCFRPKAKRHGTFEELIASGQIDIWKKDSDGGFSMQQRLTGIKAVRQGDGLLIELTETKLLDAILAEKPATVEFEAISAPKDRYSKNVPVNYP